MTDLVQALLRPDLALPLLAFLVDVALKAALVLALAGALAALLRKAAAATRHLVWTLALCSVLVLPVLSVVMPSWHVLPNWPAVIERVGQVPVTPRVPFSSFTAEDDQPPAILESREAASSAPASPPPPETPPVAPPAPATPSSVETENVLWQAFGSLADAARQAHWSVWLVLLWGTGVLLVLGRLLAGSIGVWWMARRAQPIYDPAWQDLADELGDRLWLRRSVQLLRSANTSMPMTWGLFRPVVMLPQDADAWPEERKRCVLAHELAHVRRWDCLTQGLAQVACALVWFNPLCWIAARRMRVEREQACDDQVLACGTRPSAYATHLLDIARSTRSSFVSPLNAVSMARPSQLEGRVLAILDADRRRTALGRVTLGLAVALAALLVVPIAAMRPSGEAVPAAALAGDELGEESTVEQVATSDASDLFVWEGTVDADATVEIDARWGDVHVGPSTGSTVKVRAFRAAGSSTDRVQVTQEGKTLVICAPVPQTEVCQPGSWKRSESDASAHDRARIDLKVLIPPTTRLVAHGIEGNISVPDHEGAVTAQTIEGNVSVATSGYAQARTVDGNLTVRMGQTDWTGKLDLTTKEGNIDVLLPQHADVEVYATAEEGTARSDYALKQRHRADGMLLWGTLGEGGRRLTLRTTEGTIALRASNPMADGAAAEADRLQGMLRRSSEAVRVRVAEVLGHERDASSVPLLAGLVRQDPSARVRKTAAWALGEVESVEGIAALTEALQDQDSKVRAKAAWALGEICHPKAGPTLAEVVRRDADAAVRTMAVWALGEIGDERAIPVLMTAADDADPTVRDKARWALREIGTTVTDESTDVLRRGTETQHTEVDSEVVEMAYEDPQLDVDIDVQLADLDMPRGEAVLRTVLRNAADLAREVTANEKTLRRVLEGERGMFSPDYRRALREAGVDVDNDGIVLTSQLIGITPAYVKAVRAAGYPYALEGMLKLYLMDIEPAYLWELRANGYEEIEPEMVLQLYMHGVDEAFLREMASVGYRELCPEEALELRMHGVDVTFVRQHVSPGHLPPPVDEIVQMKVSGA